METSLNGRPTMNGVRVIFVVTTYIAMASAGKSRPCDMEPCVDMFSLVGSRLQFCNGTNNARKCLDRLLGGPGCYGPVKDYTRNLQQRLHKISFCVCSSGDSLMSSVMISVGLSALTYLVTYFM